MNVIQRIVAAVREVRAKVDRLLVVTERMETDLAKLNDNVAALDKDVQRLRVVGESLLTTREEQRRNIDQFWATSWPELSGRVDRVEDRLTRLESREVA